MAEYDFLEEKVPLKIGIRYPETTMLKVLGFLMGLVLMVVTLLITGFSLTGFLLLLIGIILALFGQLLTPYTIFPSEKLPKLNALFLLIGTGLVVAGIAILGANNAELSDPSQLSFGQYLLLTVLGITFVLFIEYNHASLRFDDVLDSATRHSQEVFDVGPVLKNYYKAGSTLMVFIAGATLLLLVFNSILRWAALSANPQFGHSVVLHSVYVMAITLAIVFVPLGIFLLYYFEYMEEKLKKEEEEKRAKETAAIYT
ncbi:MAG: hypothetical protein J7L88_04505 [Thermoplasmata archaeon]|nr:hypothetical protein [Thermoplasmata archaeon]